MLSKCYLKFVDYLTFLEFLYSKHVIRGVFCIKDRALCAFQKFELKLPSKKVCAGDYNIVFDHVKGSLEDSTIYYFQVKMLFMWADKTEKSDERLKTSMVIKNNRVFRIKSRHIILLISQ